VHGSGQPMLDLTAYCHTVDHQSACPLGMLYICAPCPLHARNHRHVQRICLDAGHLCKEALALRGTRIRARACRCELPSRWRWGWTRSSAYSSPGTRC